MAQVVGKCGMFFEGSEFKAKYRAHASEYVKHPVINSITYIAVILEYIQDTGKSPRMHLCHGDPKKSCRCRSAQCHNPHIVHGASISTEQYAACCEQVRMSKSGDVTLVHKAQHHWTHLADA